MKWEYVNATSVVHKGKSTKRSPWACVQIFSDGRVVGTITHGYHTKYIEGTDPTQVRARVEDYMRAVRSG